MREGAEGERMFALLHLLAFLHACVTWLAVCVTDFGQVVRAMDRIRAERGDRGERLRGSLDRPRVTERLERQPGGGIAVTSVVGVQEIARGATEVEGDDGDITMDTSGS